MFPSFWGPRPPLDPPLWVSYSGPGDLLAEPACTTCGQHHGHPDRAEPLPRKRGRIRTGEGDAVWMTWAALGILVATGTGYGLGLLFPGLQVETNILSVAIGMVWSASTPPVIRWIRRRRRG